MPLTRLLIFLLFILTTGNGFAQLAPRPNIILIFCDDLGYGDLGCYGNPVIRTPNLDRMAMEGMKFTSFYACSPACTASRYALLTGKYPVRSGFSWVLGPTSAKGMHEQEVTLSEALKSAGYATACFGKWHLGTRKQQFLPLQNGFDVFYGLPYSNDMIPPLWGDIALMDGNDTLALNPDQSKLTSSCTDHAVDFIQKNSSKPFFIYLPFNMPHVPLHPGAAFAGRSARGAYGDVVEEIDYSVGRILKTLASENLLQNTLIFFTSDNGPWLIQGENAGSSGLLRDGKGSTWEGGMRVPALAYWPGQIGAGKVHQQTASTIDLYRTCCTLAGASWDSHQPDGSDISNLLLGNDTDENYGSNVFFYYGPGNRLQAVRKGPWKLHLITNSQLGDRYFDKQPPLLFHLDRDPGEHFEVSEQYPAIVSQLTALVDSHQAAIGAAPGFYDQERAAGRHFHKAFGKNVDYLTPAHQRYPNPLALTDGWQETADEFNHLAGFNGDSVQLQIDLGTARPIQRLEIGFLQETRSWIFLPKDVGLETSTDGVTWTQPLIRSHSVPLETRSIRQPFLWQWDTLQTVRFIRFTARSIGSCPEGHPGAGNPAWLFPDEIEVD